MCQEAQDNSLPGTIYTYRGSGRQRDRGAEGIMPSVQYWAMPRWWLLGGLGLALDAPVFWDIKDESETSYHFGPGVVVGTGWEVLHRNAFAVDVQTRLYYGAPNVPEGRSERGAFSVLLGLNWY